MSNGFFGIDLNLKKIIERNLLYLVLALLYILSILSQYYWEIFDFINGEIGLIEILQNIFLFINLYKLIKNFNNLKLISKKIYIFLKIFLLTFLIIEELSFISHGLVSFTKKYNLQNELNIHNAEFFAINIIHNVPLLGDVAIMPILVTCILFLFGFGGYLPISKNIKILFLDKKYSIYSQLYFFNAVLTRFLLSTPRIFIFSPEAVELFLYLIFLLDTNFKCHQSKLILKSKSRD
tara:strand:+ start:421 stop:1128 length:708 start_codon:yes stop_codon:yes gene_type:complete